MKWSKNKKTGIYTSDDSAWTVSSENGKWVLRGSNTDKEFRGNTLKSLQAKAEELEKELNAKEVEIQKEELKLEEVISNEVKKEVDTPKLQISNELGGFIPVQTKTLLQKF